MLLFITCFKDREAEADRTDKAEAGPATRTSPSGKDLAYFFSLPSLPIWCFSFHLLPKPVCFIVVVLSGSIWNNTSTVTPIIGH